MKTFLLSILLLPFFLGCAPKEDYFERMNDVNFQTRPEVVKFKNYVLNQTQTVYVGEALIDTYYLKVKKLNISDYSLQFQAQYTDDLIEKGKVYEARGTHKKDQNKYFIYLGKYEGENCYALSSPSGTLLSNKLFDGWGTPINDKDIFTSDGKQLFKNIGRKKLNKEDIEEVFPGSYAYKIIYNGLDGDNLKLTYREYMNDIARPAFFYELSYNLKSSNIIRYKNMKIKVLKATNELIQYIVLDDSFI